jgi:hypothetical protein
LGRPIFASSINKNTLFQSIAQENKSLVAWIRGRLKSKIWSFWAESATVVKKTRSTAISVSFSLTPGSVSWSVSFKFL